MSGDKLWNIVERAATILVAVGTLVIAYYTVGLFYGWDKPPKGGSVAAPSGTMTPLWPLIILATLTGLLLLTAWVMIFIRRGKKSEIVPNALAPGQTDNYSGDPEAEATDKQAYKEILAFALDRVIPACEAQVELQDALISQASGINTVIAALAHMGIRHSDRTKDFWNHYTSLAAGLLASPGPLIRFEAIIEHIAVLEHGNYREFFEQLNSFAIAFSINLRTDANLRPVWSKWVEAHNALVEAYDPIKRDPRFQTLLRPARPSRWGDRIQIDSIAKTIYTSEQTIDILFEPRPPYQTSEISRGRGLSTIRIGLKAVGNTFANCKVYIEKIAPQPPLPGGLPILLSGDAPILRPDDPEILIDIASQWDHVGKYRFSAPLPPMNSSSWYIDDDPPRLVEIKITARSDTGEFQKTSLFRIQVDESKKLHLERQ